MENVAQLKDYLALPKDIVIVSHRNPDGDAIGSSLGLMHYLVENHHTVHVILPSEYPPNVNWMPGVHDVIIYDIDKERSKELIDRCDAVFCLDFNSLDRIDKLGELIDVQKKQIVLIDHHLYPDLPADYSLSDTTASSTCELVFDFIEMLGHERKLNKTIGECLMTGILTDTGSFKYSTSPKLFRIVAKLLDIGVDDYMLQDLLFNDLKEKQLRILGYCLNNRMKILEEYHTGIITLSKRDYEHFDIQRGDTEGIVNYLLKIKGIKMAAFITEQPTVVKISLRSKGDFSVQDIASKYFKGGGHKNASGGYSFQSLNGTVNKFLKILPEYQEKLRLSKIGTD